MAEYLSDGQQQKIAELLSNRIARSEWPTWLLVLLIYGGWGATLWFRSRLTLLPTTLLLIVFCVWFMSLQHEIMHGHPTRYLWLNKILAYAPLAVWYPYSLYRQSHLQHHNDANLTVPGLDPETHYVDAAVWHASGHLMRTLYRWRKTFWGRMLVGPLMAISSTWGTAIEEILHGDMRHGRMWLTHGGLLVGMLVGIQHFFDIPWWYYLLFIAYPAMSVAMVRSYFEHRAAADCKHRIVINEAGLLMRILFLNNNYHLVHHDLPRLPWYLIARVYQEDRADYLSRCGGFHLHGYRELMRDYGFNPIDDPLHPLPPNPCAL
ncbi:fatty acid desaturase [Glaciimonas sp. Gout2]|uniref:fatty acid desaturase n=1 Tax=unclassified Glaciimonas TaxID=2644401 RepID=UPI002B22F47F|nr:MULTISPECIES: fatty acid desaturase [unclassified Glaciimonas]MEB0010859.1 fatty acid desaturase [Glaciimonas sp. Cout2]MEB0081640.1 fatty acid desaturase [Glaciimonas sp. Gout2]